ncbi:MAG TPA: alpha/beta fold hydrolase [Candidatus Cybelea sp.]|nr:alpha/beta fold hydrolase [Candidatus Cybelea sp.]
MIAPLLMMVALLPSGTYHYDTSIGGHSVGSSTILITRSAGTLDVGESVSVMGRTLISDRKISVANFASLSYVADANGKHLILTFAGNDATLTGSGQSVTIAAPAGAPFLVSDNMTAGFALMPATFAVTGAKQLTLACLCGAFIAVPVTVTGRPTPPPQGVAPDDEGLTVEVEGQTATLWFRRGTYVLDRFELPAQDLTIVLRSYDPAMTPLPKPVTPTPLSLPPARYASRDVSIEADDGVRLAGTLTVPTSAATPLPGFVLVHGSGCNDRDETIGPNKIFAQLANRLSNDGYAVLRYDKRSCGKSGGKFPVRDRLIADARDAIAYLRAQPGIDPKRVYVLGHSEGGELAPSIAIADKHLRGIVLLAPPALPLEQILKQQLLRNVSSADRTAMAKQVQVELDAIASGKKPSAENRWLRSTFGVDPIALIVHVPCPILILQGTKDIQVLPADTPRLVQAAQNAHRDVTVVMVQDDDHLFIKLPADEASTGGEYFTPSYLDPALFAAIETWLESH